MTLFITFAPENYNILAWATLHFSVLYHCISSVLCCNQKLILIKALKMTIHTHIFIPCQTFHHSNRPSGACQFFGY